MSARVRVATDEVGAIAVKAARTADELAALRYEAELLASTGHPGLVQVVDHIDAGWLETATELRLRYAGEPLTRWRGDLRHSAGLAAAVAATVSDLHDLGIVHGRIDATHVLVGADGRPRLCGFAPPPTEDPADDVAGLGHLVSHLVDRAIPAEQRWPFTRRRGDMADRRALADLLRRATDPVADRRPTARALASALLAAVPGAELPTFSTGGRSRRPASDDATEAAIVPDEVFDPTEPYLPLEPFSGGADDRPTETDEERRLAFGPGLDGVLDGDLDRDEHDVDPLFGDQTVTSLDEIFSNRPWPASPRPHRADRRAERAGRHRPSHLRSTRSPRRPAATTTLAGLAVVALGAGLLYAGRPGLLAGPGRQAAGTEPPLCPPPVTVDPAGIVLDVDGDGCDDGATIEGGVVAVANRRYAVGLPSDSVTLGDWNCDGTATAAVYRPDTGDVFVFGDWPNEAGGEVTVEPTARVVGGHRLVRADVAGPCPELIVEMTTGERRTVEVPG